MKLSATTISAWEIIHTIIPKCNAVEKHIEQSLNAIIETGKVPIQIESHAKLLVEFQLEIVMIRMYLDHLQKRYSSELKAVMDDPLQEEVLTLDQQEVVAVESTRQLYGRVQYFQQCC